MRTRKGLESWSSHQLSGTGGLTVPGLLLGEAAATCLSAQWYRGCSKAGLWALLPGISPERLAGMTECKLWLAEGPEVEGGLMYSPLWPLP